METQGSPESPTLGCVLTHLSRALDLGEGVPAGHAFRTARIAQRLAVELGLSEGERWSLYWAALLKDSGGSASAAPIAEAFRCDDVASKGAIKFVDWSQASHTTRFAVTQMGPQRSWLARLRYFAGMTVSPSRVLEEAIRVRSARGAGIVRTLGLGEDVARAILSLDEHWDGQGGPEGLSERAIPVLARVLCLSQTLEVFTTAEGGHVGYDVAQERAGRWFDPDMVRAALAFETDTEFWRDHARHAQGEPVELETPPLAESRESGAIDRLSEAFAGIVDAKSAFTGEHSARVARYAGAIAAYFELSEVQCGRLRRAALLHDLGNLAVPNTVLDKAGGLTPEEFQIVKTHARRSYEILHGIEGFARVAEIAAAHHERLDGRGYWRGLDADQLDLEMRILAVAEQFDALSAQRPYRAALPLDEVLRLLKREADVGIDADCVEAVHAIFGNRRQALAA
ncbi:MAG: HD domain-containing protein [Fimbriimonadaceae bacterium]|nr:HD domain-containing protein [Fimbriimonadaceae bacterium]